MEDVPRRDRDRGAGAVRPLPRRRRAVVVLPDALVEPHVAQFPESFDPWSARALFAIRAVAQRVNDHASDWLAPFGLTAAKYNYLVVLHAAKDPLALNELGAYIHTSNVAVTAMIDALEREGLVERVRHPEDRRSVLAKLTPRGRRRVERAFPIHHRNIEAAMAELPPRERKTLVHLLTKLADGFDRRAEAERESADEGGLECRRSS